MEYMGGRRARPEGVDKRAKGTASRAKAPRTMRARTTTLMRREWVAHMSGPSCARAALRAAGDNEAMPRPTARGRALVELKASCHRHAGPSSRPRRAGTPRPRRARAGHAKAGGLPGPHHGRGKARRRGEAAPGGRGRAAMAGDRAAPRPG
jgi:hypothetical protein